MKAITVPAIAALCAFLASCASLKSPHYIGEKVEFSENEVGKETVWTFDFESPQPGGDLGIYFVKILGSGELALSTARWNVKERKFALENHEAILSELDGSEFLNIKEGDLYQVYRMTRTESSVVFYVLDGDQLKELTPSGPVKLVSEGDFNDGIFELTGSKEEIDEFMRENMSAIFSSDEILVGTLVVGDSD